ncbi:PfkB family carbohydrate kinase, partial [Staphylococcus aureus]|nr:PfkB family carbohydrate kinase [Staphylococcus aureus]
MPSTGETFIGEEYEKYTGGKGANQAVAAARLGGEVSMIGKLGDDEFAKEHIESLKKEKIAHKSVLLDETS